MFVVWAADWEDPDTAQVVSVPMHTAELASAWGELHCAGMSWDVCTEAEASEWGIE